MVTPTSKYKLDTFHRSNRKYTESFYTVDKSENFDTYDVMPLAIQFNKELSENTLLTNQTVVSFLGSDQLPALIRRNFQHRFHFDLNPLRDSDTVMLSNFQKFCQADRKIIQN